MHPESDTTNTEHGTSRRKVLSGIGLAAAATAFPAVARAATANATFGSQGSFNKEYTVKKCADKRCAG